MKIDIKGLIYVVYSTLLCIGLLLPLKGHSVYEADMSDSISNNEAPEFTFKIKGRHPHDTLGYYAVNTADLDGDGKQELLVGARQNSADTSCDPNTNLPYACNEGKGELYIIYASKLDELRSQSNGNIIDLDNSTQWNIKIVGENPSHKGARVTLVDDFNNDGIDDFIFNSYLAGNTGSTYFITQKDGFMDINNQPISLIPPTGTDMGTGIILDLGNPQNWNLRIDGSGEPSGLSVTAVNLDPDADGDPSNDIKDIIIDSYGQIHVILNYDFSQSGDIRSMNNISDYNFRIIGDGDFHLNIINSSIHLVDVNNDDYDDWILSSYFGNGSVYIVDGQQLACRNTPACDYSAVDKTLTLSTLDLLRINGNGPFARTTWLTGFSVGDFDHDEKIDLLIPELATPDRIYHTLAGIRLYILLNDKLQRTNNGVNEIKSLADSANWDLQILSPGVENPYNDSTVISYLNAQGNSGANHSHAVFDVDNDAKDDIIIGHPLTSPSDPPAIKIGAGDWFVLFHDTIKTALDDPITTSIDVNISTKTGYDIRYTGENGIDFTTQVTGDKFGYSPPEFRDINNDGLLDAIAPAWTASPDGHLAAGVVYVIEYFPHTIEPDIVNVGLDQEFDFTGTVNAPDNISTINKVQFGHRQDFGQTENSDDFHTFWWDCDPVDGAFDSNSEQYTCHHAALSDDLTSPFLSPHVVYMRAQDEKGIWTPISRYVPVVFSAQQMCFPN